MIRLYIRLYHVCTISQVELKNIGVAYFHTLFCRRRNFITV
jgi:hypothetical protein